MQPVLALELSTDGILLHELSYDGVWRKIAVAALNDPFLPKKMAAMKHAARASQGRFFKSQIWLPSEQIKGLEVKLTARDPVERQVEAEALVRANPALSDAEYIVQFGEEDVNGTVKIAAINRAVLLEAQRFATNYGFGGGGFTSRERIDGFYKQPYFTPTPPPKISFNYVKVGFFAGISVLILAAAAGGYWAYTNLDFTRDPSVTIEAIEERILETDEDPRAPIRPTELALNLVYFSPETIDGGEGLGEIPAHGTASSSFEAQVTQEALSSTLLIAKNPVGAVPLVNRNIQTTPPPLLLELRPDALPAPETAGFPVTGGTVLRLTDTVPTSNFAGGVPIVRFKAILPGTAYVRSPRLTDVLPRDDSTVVLAAQLRKYNESLGLALVRQNNAALVRLARTEVLQLAPTNVIIGRPEILPVLRGGIEISNVVLPPPAPTLSIAQLQSLPPEITQGLPPITPFLRDGRNVADLPPDPVSQEIPEVEVIVIETDAEPQVQFTTIVAGLTTEQLQRIPPRLLQGRPSTLPVLRGGVEIEGAVAPPLTEPQRLRPTFRPSSIVLTALIASVSKQAVPNALAPLHRPTGFIDAAKAIADTAAEQARVTPTFDDTRREVNLPTSANVAATATIVDGINLRETSLIGIFGKPGGYSALFRKRGGTYVTLKLGERIDGWTIVAIIEDEVRLQKGSKTKTMKLPAEG